MTESIDPILLLAQLEERKKLIIRYAIDELLPRFAETDVDMARKFARSTLDDILHGNHPEMASGLRAKILALGLDLDLDQAA